MNQADSVFLQTAGRIGAQLCRDAVWDGERCNWLGDSMEFVGGAWTVAYRAFGPDLYSGTSGIALFLARLFQLTGERVVRVTAEGGLRQALSQWKQIPAPARIGFYSGMTGIGYAAITLGEIFGNQNYIEQGLAILEDMRAEDPNEQGLDVIAGSAGAIPALLDVYSRYRKDWLLDLAVRHGEHLIETARKNDVGWSWNTLNATSGRDLTGFSHGTAGIGWALLELSTRTRQERFRIAAEEAFRYEQHWFSPEHGNWPDFRNLSDPSAGGVGGGTPTYMLAWCHGAPGIGLSRLRAYQLTGNDTYRREAESAVQTTANMLAQSASSGQSGFSLCHGLAGNAELVLYASQVLGGSRYRTLAEQLGKQGIEQYAKTNTPWSCGVPGGGETPNLMLGIAGIGYFYLRLAQPQQIPSLLILLPCQESSKTSAVPTSSRSSRKNRSRKHK